MKALFQNRASAFEVSGGDTVQMVETKKHLEILGAEVDVSFDPSINLQKYDLVHIFNTQTIDEPLAFCQNAKKQNKPIIFSTVYWNLEEWRIARDAFNNLIKPRSKFVWNIKRFLLHKASIKKDIKKKQKTALGLADILLPNAQVEMDRIIKDFGPFNNYQVVYNAADLNYLDADPNIFCRKYNLNDFVLCVGRIESRKNQFFLIEALKNTGLTLVFIGKIFQNDYVKACLKKASKNVIFIDEVPRETLRSAYSAAKVHALPSWFETPGLVSLEAGLAGCNIVSTDRGTAREYFGDLAWYCDPSDLRSIRKAVLKAYEAPKGTELIDHIKNNFTWEKAAKKTLGAYLKVLDRKNI